MINRSVLCLRSAGCTLAAQMFQQTLRSPAVPTVTLPTTDVDEPSVSSFTASDESEPDPPPSVKGVRPRVCDGLTALETFLIGVFYGLSDDDEHFHQIRGQLCRSSVVRGNFLCHGWQCDGCLGGNRLMRSHQGFILIKLR